MKVPKITRGAHLRKLGSASGRGIGGGANKRAGALTATPAKDALTMRKG